MRPRGAWPFCGSAGMWTYAPVEQGTGRRHNSRRPVIVTSWDQIEAQRTIVTILVESVPPAFITTV